MDTYKDQEVPIEELVCPVCGEDNPLAIEYSYTDDNHYDGTSEFKCTRCHYREGRWSGKELKEDEQETRYGGS